MGLSAEFYLVKEQLGLHYLDQLLQNLALEFEATHVSVVSHHSQRVLDDQHVEALVEYGGDRGFSHN